MKRPPQDDIELIERYFDNGLSPEESDNLKDRLKSDFEFQKLFDREKLLINTIRFEAASRDLRYLKALEHSLSEKKTTPHNRLWYYLAAAASVAILALALWKPWEDPDPQALYAEYFQPHANIFEPIRRGETVLTPGAEAFRAYEQKDYIRASSLFAEALKENNDPGMLMLLGNANLMIGETAQAKQNFRTLIGQYDDLDTAGKWYLSLAHLKDGETDAALVLLHEIKGSASPYAGKAQSLLGELE